MRHCTGWHAHAWRMVHAICTPTLSLSLSLCMCVCMWLYPARCFCFQRILCGSRWRLAPGVVIRRTLNYVYCFLVCEEQPTHHVLLVILPSTIPPTHTHTPTHTQLVSFLAHVRLCVVRWERSNLSRRVVLAVWVKVAQWFSNHYQHHHHQHPLMVWGVCVSSHPQQHRTRVYSPLTAERKEVVLSSTGWQRSLLRYDDAIKYASRFGEPATPPTTTANGYFPSPWQRGVTTGIGFSSSVLARILASRWQYPF